MLLHFLRIYLNLNMGGWLNCQPPLLHVEFVLRALLRYLLISTFYDLFPLSLGVSEVFVRYSFWMLLSCIMRI